MKLFLFIICLGLNRPLFAEDFFPVDKVVVQLSAENPLSALDESLKNPEELLKKFKPVGAKITSKSVSHNQITFFATKTFLLISKTIKVHGILDANENNVGCANDETGYDIKFDFYGSDRLVSDNIDRIETKMCAKVFPPNKIVLTIKSKIMKANNFSNPVGSFVKSIIEAQVPALVQAISDTIQ